MVPKQCMRSVLLCCVLALANCTANRTSPESDLWTVSGQSVTSSARRAKIVPPSPGCFGQQVASETWGARIAAATVRVETPSGKSSVVGTGFIVKGSASKDGHERIVTAAHAADGILSVGGLVTITSSSGVRLGIADIVAMGEQWEEPNVGFGGNLPRGDIAVLAMRAFAPSKRDTYDGIEGISIAPEQSEQALRGIITDPAGPAGGASGSAILDAEGRAVAVMVRTQDLDPAPPEGAMWGVMGTRVVGGDLFASSLPDGSPHPVNVKLPARARTYGEPILGIAVLAELGAAGRQVSVRDSPAPPQPVRIVGFPKSTCIAYRGVMASLSKDAN